MVHDVPRIAEKCQYPSLASIPRIGQQLKIQRVTIPVMDYKKEIGRRIRQCRTERAWTLADLAKETGDVLTLKRINAYENGDRMPGPAEAVILAKALEVRPAFLLAVDDTQIPISPQEESLIRNWRTLNERDRMAIFRNVEALSMANRDPISDITVERHIPQSVPRLPVPKRVKK